MSNIEMIPGYGQGMRMGRAFGEAILWIYMVVARPIALVTGTLFRHKTGERYFTNVHFAIAWFVIGIATLLTVTTPLVSPHDALNLAASGSRERLSPSIPWFGLVVGGVWMLLFFITYFEHRIKVWMRYEYAERWHSRSRGIPRLDFMSPFIELAITLAASFVLFYFGLIFFAALAFFSGAQSIAEHNHAKRELHNRVLDAIDAQLENEVFAEAMNHHLTPKQSKGIVAWIPTTYRGKSMRNFAKVATPTTPLPSSNLELKAGDQSLMPTD